MTIASRNLSWGVGGKAILQDVSVDIAPGTTLGLLGPNGSGKSSLLRLLAGLRRPDRGQVTLDGRDIARIGRRDLARRVALVQQHAATQMNVTVEDVVMLGRTPHRAPLAGWTAADRAAVDRALAQVDMTAFRHAPWQVLSGGERQRVQLARALAQDPRELFLDEPTNHLDIQHQLELMRLIARLGLTSIVALHDLNHAAQFCDRLLVLDRGRVVADGPPDQVLTPALLAQVFRVDCDFHRSPDGRRHILFR
ncbi:ABC transporter ATP-binding protein [Paracoccus aestuarii]|uniref:ABC transporter ATP-binding protein n=1 Tax=Paracoccus aestuarii TaxID=453842 RepID=A0A418ZTH2_9RHOB|nr:ABC transporter ATP-binding protein [Paracoccus aestuarii]RJL01465.1 ABC transporter ATP-binding protein [Paracoccus aestuarii]WCR00955.1 ABC transporter ATP-binding protein [Paracoccus aestuarii]